MSTSNMHVSIYLAKADLSCFIVTVPAEKMSDRTESLKVWFHLAVTSPLLHEVCKQSRIIKIINERGIHHS